MQDERVSFFFLMKRLLLSFILEKRVLITHRNVPAKRMIILAFCLVLMLSVK